MRVMHPLAMSALIYERRENGVDRAEYKLVGLFDLVEKYVGCGVEPREVTRLKVVLEGDWDCDTRRRGRITLG